MNNLLKQELYKLALKKSLKWLFGILFILVIILGNVFARFGGSSEYFTSYGYVGMFISIIVLVNASSTLMTELHSGSIKILLSRQYSRITVFFSKLITLLLLHFALLFTAFVGMMLSRFIFFAGKTVKISWFEPVIANLLTTWMVAAITILLVVLLRSSALALTIGMILTVGGLTYFSGHDAFNRPLCVCKMVAYQHVAGWSRISPPPIRSADEPLGTSDCHWEFSLLNHLYGLSHLEL